MADADGGPEIAGIVLRMLPWWRALRSLFWGILYSLGTSVGLLLAGTGGSSVLVVAVAIAVCATSIAFRILGRYTLEIDADGLTHRYRFWRSHDGGPGFRLVVPWPLVGSIGPGRALGLLPVEVLAASAGAVLEGPDGSPIDQRLRRNLRRNETDRRIILTYYCADWADGPVGAALRTHRPDLMP